MGQLDDDKLVKTFRSKQAAAQCLTCRPKSLVRREGKKETCLKLTQMRKDWLHPPHVCSCTGHMVVRSGVEGLRWGFSWKCEMEGRRWAGVFLFFSRVDCWRFSLFFIISFSCLFLSKGATSGRLKMIPRYQVHFADTVYPKTVAACCCSSSTRHFPL